MDYTCEHFVHLQVTKKSLETEVNTLREQEKRTCYDVKKLKEDHSVEMARMRKETEIEIRKLVSFHQN